MQSPRELVKGRYLSDILDQPKAIRETLDRLRISDEIYRIREDLHQGVLKRIVLTGMGSSYFALTPSYIQLTASGYEVAMVETSEMLHYLPDLFAEDSLIVIVSQSGRSAEVVRLLEVNPKRSPFIAITNASDSPLAKASNALLLTNAGEEFSVSTKSYVTSLIALEMLTNVLSFGEENAKKSELSAVSGAVAAYLAGWREHVEEISGVIQDSDQFFFLGRGCSLAAAGTGALITKESVRVHAEAMSSASFRHGPMEMLSDRVFVGMFQGANKTESLNKQLVSEIRQAEGRAELIGSDSAVRAFVLPHYSNVTSPVMEILPIQMLTIALGYLGGIEAGNFIRATKVTTVE